MNTLPYEKKSTPDAKQGTSKIITATEDNEGSALTLDGYVDVKNFKLKPQAPMSTVERKVALTSRRSGVRNVRRGKGGNKGQRGALRLPPELQVSVIIGHTFRFRNSSAIVGQSVTVGQLIGICGVIGTVTNTTVASIASSVKLRHIAIWPSEDTSTAHNPEISFATNYGTTSDRSVSKSLPLGISVTGAFTARPKADTLAALWQNSSASSSTLLTLYDIPAGSVIDVSVTFVLRNSQNGLSYSVATAVLGTMYYLYLDATGTHVIQPVGLPNTF